MGERSKGSGRSPQRADTDIGLCEESQDFLVFPRSPARPLTGETPTSGLDPDPSTPGAPFRPRPASSSTAAAKAAVRSVLYLGHRADTVDPLRHVFRHATWRARRVHIDAGVPSDRVASLADLEVTPETSFDAVWACHALQCFDALLVPRALHHILRILKPGGFVVVLVPDLQAVAALIVADSVDEAMPLPTGGAVSAIDLVYGPRSPLTNGSGPPLAYRTGFTASRVAAALVGAGFQRVRTRRQGLDLWAIGHRPSSVTEAPPVDVPAP